MRNYTVFILVLLASVYMCGCNKKEAAQQELQEPASMVALSTVTNEPVTHAPAVTNQSAEVKTQAAPAAGEAKLEPLPPQGPYNPTAIEIQTALKNAGVYTGTIDGKVGSLTKKAIEEFQKTHNLRADGKVGPKTWAALSQYLNPAPAPETRPAKKSKKR